MRRESARHYDRHLRNPEAKRFYNSSAWLAVRADVLARDPVCQKCLREWSRHVHHVIPLAECLPEQRLDPANLRALCPPCHNIVEAEAAAEQRGRP